MNRLTSSQEDDEIIDLQALFATDNDVYIPGATAQHNTVHSSTNVSNGLTAWSVGGGSSVGLNDEDLFASRDNATFVGLLNQGATCYLNSLLQVMYLTPELRSGIFNIPKDFLSQAHNYPSKAEEEEEDSNQINNLDDDNDETKTNVDEKINDNNKNSEEQKEIEMTAFSSSNATHSSDGDDNAFSSTTLSSSKPERTVSYPLENFMAMGFDMEMIQRVSQVYPNDANACLECLLGGGISEAEARADESTNIADVGAVRRNAIDETYPSLASSTTVANNTTTTTTGAAAVIPLPAPASPPKRATAADVLYELQALFTNLQLSRRRAVSTRALTDAFGWKGSQSVQQHDVHELNRMLLDVLERALRRTPQSTLVHRLYGGTSTTSLCCSACGTARHQTETLLDLPLPVRDTLSLHAALAALCCDEQIETPLTCDQCDARHPHTRRVRLGRTTSAPSHNNTTVKDNADADPSAAPSSSASSSSDGLPDLLWLPLVRFDYDRERFTRIKLSTPFMYSLELDLESYLEGSESNHNNEAENFVPKDPSNPTDEEMLHYLCLPASNQDSKCLYDLQAVVIHAGGPFGGHYHVLARQAPFDDDEQAVWHDFNDSRVSKLAATPRGCAASDNAALSALCKVMQGTESGYMLLYRRRVQSQPLRETKLVPPPVTAAAVLAENQQAQREHNERLRRRNAITLDIAVPQWLALDAADGVARLPNGERSSLPMSPGDALSSELPLDYMHVTRMPLADNSDAPTLRIRVSCDRRAPLASLRTTLFDYLPLPPSRDDGESSLCLTPLRFRNKAAVINMAPLCTIVNDSEQIDDDSTTTTTTTTTTLADVGLCGRQVRLLLWDGKTLSAEPPIDYRGPPLSLDFVHVVEGEPVDGLPAHSSHTVSLPETAPLRDTLMSAVQTIVDAQPQPDDDVDWSGRWTLSELGAQRGTVKVAGTRDSAGVWQRWWPHDAERVAVCDAGIRGGGMMLALEQWSAPTADDPLSDAVADDALPPLTTAFVEMRRDMRRVFVLDGRATPAARNEADRLATIYTRANDTVADVKRRALSILMGNDTDEVETYRAFRSCRLRRYRGGSDLACTDFNEIFHLREEDRLLKHYAVDDGQRLLLEDVTWREERALRGIVDDFEDSDEDHPNTSTTTRQHNNNSTNNNNNDNDDDNEDADGKGALRITLALSDSIKERIKTARPDIDLVQALAAPLRVPRDCSTKKLAQLINKRLQLDSLRIFDTPSNNGKLTKAQRRQLSKQREAAAWHMCLVDFFGRPARRILCANEQSSSGAAKRGRKHNQRHEISIRDYDLCDNDTVWIGAGASRDNVAELSFQLFQFAFEYDASRETKVVANVSVEKEKKHEPMDEIVTNDLSTDDLTSTNNSNNNDVVAAVDNESQTVEKPIDVLDNYNLEENNGEEEDEEESNLRWIDEPERELVTPLQALGNRYASLDAVSSRFSSLDHLFERDFKLDSTLDDVRKAILNSRELQTVLRKTRELNASTVDRNGGDDAGDFTAKSNTITSESVDQISRAVDVASIDNKVDQPNESEQQLNEPLEQAKVDVSGFRCRLWLKTRLLRGATTTLRSLRVRERDMITAQLVSCHAPDTYNIDDADDNNDDGQNKLDAARPATQVHQLATDMNDKENSSTTTTTSTSTTTVAATTTTTTTAPPPPPPPPSSSSSLSNKNKHMALPLFVYAYRRNAATRRFFVRPLEVTFRGTTLDQLKDEIAKTLRTAANSGAQCAPGDEHVTGSQIQVAKFLLHNGTYVPLRDAPTINDTDNNNGNNNNDMNNSKVNVESTTNSTPESKIETNNNNNNINNNNNNNNNNKNQKKKKKKNVDRLRGQPYHLRDGDVLAFRLVSEAHDDFAHAKRARRTDGRVSGARGSLADVVARIGRDEPSLSFDIDFDDQH